MPFTPLTVDREVPSAPAIASAVPPSFPVLPKAMNCVCVCPLCFLGCDPCTRTCRFLRAELSGAGAGALGTGVLGVFGSSTTSSHTWSPEQKEDTSGPASCSSSAFDSDFWDT